SFSNQSLVERDTSTCQLGYYQCPGSTLCCSKPCGEICGSIGCCQLGYSCCGLYCCNSNSFCCSDKSGCCPLGYKCGSSGLCSRPTLSPKIIEITQEVV
ncbi:6036_t:CDS:1, partial [Cetraspora pellucida]